MEPARKRREASRLYDNFLPINIDFVKNDQVELLICPKINYLNGTFYLLLLF